MGNKISKINLRKAGLTALIWILAFQSPLEKVWDPFSYIDELTALIGACLGLYDIVVVRKGRPSKEQLWMGIPLLIFVAVGLAGNAIYQYQPLKCVIIDLYTNLKFFFAIGTGYYLFASMDWDEMKKTAGWNTRFITLFLFTVFLIDRVFHIWPGQVRYGISSAVLFYFHPTYLAGAMAFLLTLLTIFYNKKNILYIIMSLIIMVFTLRTKSIASAVMYVAIFIFFIVLKLHLKLWHIAVAGIGCIAIAWEKIQYYFIDFPDRSARAVILRKSFQVMKDHWPLGSGFGTFGSSEAAKCYSPVYNIYGFNDYYYLRDVRDIENTLQLISQDAWFSEQYKLFPDTYLYGVTFLSDHFWPIIFGQSGILGTVTFSVILVVLLNRCLHVQKENVHFCGGVIFIMCYLMISSMAEPAFHNAIAVSLALLIGMVFANNEKEKY